MLKKIYPKAMLPNVDYQDLEDEDSFEGITDLEYETMRNLYDFTEELKDILLQKNMGQTLELIISHLCAYLGFLTVASLGLKQATELQIKITKLLEEQTKTAYDLFCKSPVSSSLSGEVKTRNFDQLRENSPGSLVVQTIRLGGIVWRNFQELAENRKSHIRFTNEKQAEFFCPQDIFIPFLKEASSKIIRESKNGIPIAYVLNQMTIQLGWLIGYYGHLDRQFPKTYLEFGIPCIGLYIDFGHKFLEAMNSADKSTKNG